MLNFGQSRKFMQTMLLANGCKDLIEAEKTLSLRGMYYKTLHTIPGTKEKTFDDQEESDPILEDLEVALAALREELHVGPQATQVSLLRPARRWRCSPSSTVPSGLPPILRTLAPLRPGPFMPARAQAFDVQ